jgi:hypothetical protein
VRDRFYDEVIKNLCATRLVGVAAVESATGMNFNELFTDFTRALVMSGTGDFGNLTLSGTDAQGTVFGLSY